MSNKTGPWCTETNGSNCPADTPNGCSYAGHCNRSQVCQELEQKQITRGKYNTLPSKPDKCTNCMRLYKNDHGHYMCIRLTEFDIIPPNCSHSDIFLNNNQIAPKPTPPPVYKPKEIKCKQCNHNILPREKCWWCGTQD